jgi:ABC-type sugar transport system ATPase subunit
MLSLSTDLKPLRVENLIKSYDDFVLNAHFQVEVGERLALVGKSGGGKTTLLRLIAGLDSLQPPTGSGRVFLGERDLTQTPPQNRQIGLVFQDQALFSHFNVLENVAFGLKVRGMPKKLREKEAKEWLMKAGLSEKANQAVSYLSGGEKQRVAFIRALIWHPQIVLLDEPFSALDPELRTSLRQELMELHRLWPAPLIIVTHDETDLHTLATGKLLLEWDQKSPVRTVKREVNC